MIPATHLPAPWIPVVVEETPGKLVVPETPHGYLWTVGERWRHSDNPGPHDPDAWGSTVRAVRVINRDGSTAAEITRPTTTTRRWKVQPPDNAADVAIMHTNGAVCQYTASDCKTAQPDELGWMLWSDWLAFLAAPRAVEVTAEDVALAMKETLYHEQIAAHITARLRARAPKPSLDWLTGEALCEEMNISFDHIDSDAREFYNAAAARLRALGGAA